MERKNGLNECWMGSFGCNLEKNISRKKSRRRKKSHRRKEAHRRAQKDG